MEVKFQKLRKSDFDYGKKEEGDGESGEEEWEGADYNKDRKIAVGMASLHF